MTGAFETPPTRPGIGTRTDAAAGTASSASRLPPTRAARPARSRGVFFRIASRWRADWIGHALCIALVSLLIAVSAHFAQPAFDSATLTSNVGPELLASTMRAPAFLSKPALDCSKQGARTC
jgi:hypothetical protein